MPELPEVETVCRSLQPHLNNCKIINTIVRQPKLRWPIPENLSVLLKNNNILTLYRRAKYLLFKLNHGTLIIHLGMSGKLSLLPQDSKILKHDHVDFYLNNNKVLRYNDPRRFGAILWTDQDINNYSILKNLGPEPLTKEFNAQLLIKASKNRNIAIKEFIMNNAIVVGVGNIYATEALFKAGIHPARPASQVSPLEYKKLVIAIKNTLKQAIAKGGTTLRDFFDADGKPGYFAQTLLLYGRKGLPCPTCSGILVAIKIGQRNSVYCKNCQI